MADVISILVVIVFVYIVTKKVFLPRLALKRAAKAGQTVMQQPGQTVPGQTIPATGASLFPADIMQAGRFSGHIPQTPSSRPVTCFDMRLIDLSTVGKSDGDTVEQRVTYAASELLLSLCSRGVVPTLSALMLTDNILMLYATYSA